MGRRTRSGQTNLDVGVPVQTKLGHFGGLQNGFPGPSGEHVCRLDIFEWLGEAGSGRGGRAEDERPGGTTATHGEIVGECVG